MNCMIFVRSFIPGSLSMLLLTSTAYGCTVLIASPTFSALSPPLTITCPNFFVWTANVQSDSFPVPPIFPLLECVDQIGNTLHALQGTDVEPRARAQRLDHRIGQRPCQLRQTHRREAAQPGSPSQLTMSRINAESRIDKHSHRLSRMAEYSV